MLRFFILRIHIYLTLHPHPAGWEFIIDHYQEMGVGRSPSPLGSWGGGLGGTQDIVDNHQLFCPNNASGMLIVKIFIVMVMMPEPSSIRLGGNPLMVLDCEILHKSLNDVYNQIWVFLILKFLLMLSPGTRSLEWAM